MDGTRDERKTAGNDDIKSVRIEKLRRQRVLYSMMTKVFDNVIWRFDLETMTVLDVSPSVKKVRGFDPEEIVGRGMKELLMPDSYKRIKEHIPEWLASLSHSLTREIQFIETVEQPCRGGTTVWVEIAVCLFRRMNGGIEAAGISRRLDQHGHPADLCRRMSEREQSLRLFIDAAPCFLCCINYDGTLLQVNQRFADFWGIDRQEIQGRPFGDAIAPELREKHTRMFLEALQGKTMDFLDQYQRAGSKKKIWTHGVYAPIRSSDGIVEKIIVAVMDVSERSEMKQQLIEAERLGKTGSWKINLTTRKFTCSDGILELFGVSREELERESYRILYSRSASDDVKKIKKGILSLFRNNSYFSEEVHAHLSNGEIRLIRVSGVTLKNSDGRSSDILGRIEDITQQSERDKTEKDIIVRLREFSKSMPGAGMILDELGNIIEIFDENKLLSLNISRELSWGNICDLFPIEISQKLIQKVKSAIDNKTPQFDEFVLISELGSRCFSVRIVPIAYKISNKSTVACNMLDVTEQNKIKKMSDPAYARQRRNDLLNGLIEGRIAPSREVLDQAWQVRLNLGRNFSCFLIAFKGSLDSQEMPRERERKTHAAIDDLMGLLAGNSEVIAWESKEGIAVLVPALHDVRDIQLEEREQASSWQGAIDEYAPEIEICIGIAEFHENTFWNLAKVYGQARTAAELGEKLEPGVCIHHYLDIGVFQFFPAVLDKEHVNDFISRTLGRLEEYDRTHGTDLENTLTKIMQSNNLEEVAEQLYVHRQTVLFRKRRIEKVLNVSLRDSETRLALGMALKFKQVFRQ